MSSLESSAVFRPIERPAREPQRRPRSTWRVFEELVETRRAVRSFRPDPVPEHDMRGALDVARLAPTGSNLQPFELIWVRSQTARDRVVGACLCPEPVETAAELVVVVARWDRCEQTRRELLHRLRAAPDHSRVDAFYYDHLAPWSYDMGPLGLYGRIRQLLSAPARLAFPLPRGPVDRADVRTWAVKSAALVSDHFMLAARARGLDTCPMEGVDPVRVGRAVGLSGWWWKRRWDLAMVIAVGYRAQGEPRHARWRRARHEQVREV